MCRELALATARRLLCFKRVVEVSVSGGPSSRFCQGVAVALGGSFLFRLQWANGEREM